MICDAYPFVLFAPALRRGKNVAKVNFLNPLVDYPYLGKTGWIRLT